MYHHEEAHVPPHGAAGAWASRWRCRSSRRWCRREPRWRKTAAGQGAAWRPSRWCTARPAATAFGVKKNLWSPAAVGPRLRPVAEQPGAARAVPRLPDDRQQHRRAQRRGVHRAGNRRRPLPLERGVPDPGASEADAGLGRARRHLARPDATRRRFGQDTPIPSMQLCIENVDQAGGCSYGYSCVYTDIDQLGVADRAAADDARPARGLRPAVRRRRDARRARASAAPRTRASSTGSTAEVARLQQGPRRRRSRPPGRLPRRRARDRAPHPAGRGLERQRRAARAAGRADRRARLVRRARQADVRPAGAGLRVGHHARVLVQAGPRRLEPRLPGERRQDRASTPRRTTATARIASLEFAKINKYHVSMLPYFLEKLKNTPDGDSNLLDNTLVHLRLADGQLERAQPQALPAVPRRPRRRRAEGRPARQGRRRHADGQRDADACCTRSAWTT